MSATATERPAPRGSSGPRRPRAAAVAAAAGIVMAFLVGPGVVSYLGEPNDDGMWTLVAAPDPVPLGLPLSIDSREVRGTGPCNDFRAAWSSRDGVVGDGIVSTAIACPAPVGPQEDAYLDLLSAVDEIVARGGRLVLTGPTGSLVYDRS